MRLTMLGGCVPVLQPSWDGLRPMRPREREELRELLDARADLTKCLQRPHAVR